MLDDEGILTPMSFQVCFAVMNGVFSSFHTNGGVKSVYFDLIVKKINGLKFEIYM